MENSAQAPRSLFFSLSSCPIRIGLAFHSFAILDKAEFSSHSYFLSFHDILADKRPHSTCDPAIIVRAMIDEKARSRRCAFA
jgi:hypothetical protein